MKKLATTIIAAATFGMATAATADQFGTEIPMREKGAATYYVPGQIEGLGDIELMVDTGSGYVTINEHTLAILTEKNHAHYVRDLRGILANGSEMIVPVYRISALNIGKNCWLNDVEAAVFPGKTRFILGLSALEKAAPFIFSTNPPALTLSNCGNPPSADKVAVNDVPH